LDSDPVSYCLALQAFLWNLGGSPHDCLILEFCMPTKPVPLGQGLLQDPTVSASESLTGWAQGNEAWGNNSLCSPTRAGWHKFLCSNLGWMESCIFLRFHQGIIRIVPVQSTWLLFDGTLISLATGPSLSTILSPVTAFRAKLKNFQNFPVCFFAPNFYYKSG
jgi:hypothetical protein